jgi:ABC-type lipoprotein export system ATPase subunit
VVVAGRAALTWAGEVAAHRASTDVIRQLRARLVAHTLRLGPRHRDLPPDPARVPIRLQGVGMDGRGGRVLDGFDLTIEPGTLVGIRGRSGAGKSTLLDLPLALRNPDTGRITVGGTDLADIDRDAWLRRVAWLPQRPLLLAGTVAANIRLRDPGAGRSRVHAAADAAALDGPLETVIGDHGTGLSTEQVRRVALARAVLADRGLLLLDEPTEGVDADTAAASVAALPGITTGRTAVIVSHRAEVLAACDRVVDIPSLVPCSPAPITAAARTSPPSPRPDLEVCAPAPPDPAIQTTPDGALAWTLAAARPNADGSPSPCCSAAPRWVAASRSPRPRPGSSRPRHCTHRCSPCSWRSSPSARSGSARASYATPSGLCRTTPHCAPPPPCRGDRPSGRAAAVHGDAVRHGPGDADGWVRRRADR